MTTTTDEYWAVDGVSLQTYAYNIQTLGGDRMAPPAPRGSNIDVPYRPGSIWTPRVPGDRTISLGMWVTGANPDGTMPSQDSVRRNFDRNWKTLTRLFAGYRKQFTLTKRFWIPTADLTAAGATAQALKVDGSWSLIEASAQASWSSGLSPAMNGPARAAFTVDILLSDPFFYSDEISVTFAAGASVVTTYLGDDRTNHVNVEFRGPSTTPRLRHTAQGQWVQYSAALVSGAVVNVDVDNFSATRTQSGATTPVSGSIEHTGDRFWYYVEPGRSTAGYSVASGTGTAILKYRPAWF